MIGYTRPSFRHAKQTKTSLTLPIPPITINPLPNEDDTRRDARALQAIPRRQSQVVSMTFSDHYLPQSKARLDLAGRGQMLSSGIHFPTLLATCMR